MKLVVSLVARLSIGFATSARAQDTRDDRSRKPLSQRSLEWLRRCAVAARSVYTGPRRVVVAQERAADRDRRTPLDLLHLRGHIR
jgi:hypothetical protein